MSAGATTLDSGRRPQPLTARALALASCPDCQLLMRLRGIEDGRCPRCHATVRSRKQGGLLRSWALLVAAAILYIPANLFPIMTVTSFGVAESDTIVSGMIYLLLDDTWPLGVIVFIASIVVPVVKIGVLSYLLITVHRRSTSGLRDRAKLYRMIETIGRWSMVDVYVVTIVVALVRLGNLANVRAEPGAMFFGAVVVLTMLAAASFDPRRIWDTTLEQPT
jgi:paraquat-inducible protein A